MEQNKLKASKKAELVIIGGGGAGLPAAVSAAEKGLSNILILEKRTRPGGNAALAWGIFAAESPVQKEALVEARKEVLFRAMMSWSHWKIDPGILQAFVGKSGDTIKWLESKGVKFELLRYFPNQEPPVWHVPEGHGAQIVDVLERCCKDLGVQILLNTSCTEILTDYQGHVSGVVANNNGENVTIQAKNVIIASGGYSGNRELLEKYYEYFDENIHCVGIPHSGDGLLMATKIGAATASLGLLLLEWPHVHGDPSAILETIAKEPYAVYVNKAGKRFIDEAEGLHAFECANAVLRQPGKTGYILVDEEMITNLETNGAILGRGKNRAERRRSIPALRDQIRTTAKNSESVIMSHSWDEIAQWIGASPDALKTTISEYNFDCNRGYDSALGKDRLYLMPLLKPPYYAIKGELIFLQTMGGLKINEQMEVLDWQGDSIQGLYAAGADTGGWVADTYCDRFSGTAFGYSINSGRIAGENVAAKILGQAQT